MFVKLQLSRHHLDLPINPNDNALIVAKLAPSSIIKNSFSLNCSIIIIIVV